MPHDKNGAVLQVGDRVTVLCEVKELHLTEDFCNVSLRTVEPMFPGDRHDTLTLNAKQTVKIE
jgi:hypothetical protein